MFNPKEYVELAEIAEEHGGWDYENGNMFLFASQEDRDAFIVDANKEYLKTPEIAPLAACRKWSDLRLTLNKKYGGILIPIYCPMGMSFVEAKKISIDAVNLAIKNGLIKYSNGEFAISDESYKILQEYFNETFGEELFNKSAHNHVTPSSSDELKLSDAEKNTSTATPKYTLPQGYTTESSKNLSEADRNEFILKSDGSKDFGQIDEQTVHVANEALEKLGENFRLKAAPIRLQVGTEDTYDEEGNAIDGFGYKHILEHINEIQSRGFKNIPEYVIHILKNFNQIYKSNAKKNRIILYCKGDFSKGLMPIDLELEKGDDDYYTIVTAYPRRRVKKEDTLLVDTRPTNVSTDTASVPRLQDSNDKSGVASRRDIAESNVSSAENISQSANEGNIATENNTEQNPPLNRLMSKEELQKIVTDKTRSPETRAEAALKLVGLNKENVNIPKGAQIKNVGLKGYSNGDFGVGFNARFDGGTRANSEKIAYEFHSQFEKLCKILGGRAIKNTFRFKNNNDATAFKKAVANVVFGEDFKDNDLFAFEKIFNMNRVNEDIEKLSTGLAQKEPTLQQALKKKNIFRLLIESSAVKLPNNKTTTLHEFLESLSYEQLSHLIEKYTQTEYGSGNKEELIQGFREMLKILKQIEEGNISKENAQKTLEQSPVLSKCAAMLFDLIHSNKNHLLRTIIDGGAEENRQENKTVLTSDDLPRKIGENPLTWIEQNKFKYDETKSVEENMAAAERLVQEYLDKFGITANINTPERIAMRRQIIEELYGNGAQKNFGNGTSCKR